MPDPAPPPPLLGAHLSIAGGLHRAVDRAEALGATALQVFTRSARAWRAPPLPQEEVRRFRERLRSSGVRAVLAHAGYLANPASPDRALRRRSERALVEELNRCERLGIPWLVLHPGSHRGAGSAGGVRRAGALLGRVLRTTSGFRAGLLVENTAGCGDALGASLEEVAALLAAAGDRRRLGMCLDTCHAFAAGYDLASGPGWSHFRGALSRAVGLRRVRAVHVNDSAGGLGSRIDRHAGIGLGEIGLAAFRRLLRDPALGRRPLILETPKGRGGEMDRRNLALLRDPGAGDGRIGSGIRVPGVD